MKYLIPLLLTLMLALPSLATDYEVVTLYRITYADLYNTEGNHSCEYYIRCGSATKLARLKKKVAATDKLVRLQDCKSPFGDTNQFWVKMTWTD